MRGAGTRDIKVVVSDSSGNTVEGHAQIEVREGGGGGSPFLQTLTSGSTLSGEAWETQGPRGGRRWPFQVKVTSYDPGTGAIVGELTWPTLSSVHRIRGLLAGTTLTFTETEAIQPGSAHLNVSYDLTVGQSSADGTYNDHTDNTSGGAKLTAP
jgi:hypothetical protein